MILPRPIDTAAPNLWPIVAHPASEIAERAKWRAAHGITVIYHPLHVPGFDWIARISLSQIRAATEDEAEREIARKHNINHWHGNLPLE